MRLIASNLGRNVVVAIVVLKDSPIKGLADLKGKRIVAGDRGWGTTELAEALMAGSGMPIDKFKADGGTVSYTSITDRSKALQDKNVDAIFIPAQVNYPDLMAVQQAAGIRVIGFPNDLVERDPEHDARSREEQDPQGPLRRGRPGPRLARVPAAAHRRRRASPTSWSTASPSSGGRRSRTSTRSRPGSTRPT